MPDNLIVTWAKQLKVEEDPLVIAAEILNKYKNYQSACCLIFGLSATLHRDWIRAAAAYLEENIKSWPEGTLATKDWLLMFKSHYIEKAQLP